MATSLFVSRQHVQVSKYVVGAARSSNDSASSSLLEICIRKLLPVPHAGDRTVCSQSLPPCTGELAQLISSTSNATACFVLDRLVGEHCTLLRDADSLCSVLDDKWILDVLSVARLPVVELAFSPQVALYMYDELFQNIIAACADTLEVLDLSGCTRVSPAVVRAVLPLIPNLRVFRCVGLTTVYPADVLPFASPSLERLVMSSTRMELTPGAKNIVGSSRIYDRLKELVVSGVCCIDKDIAWLLSIAPNVETLDISNNKCVMLGSDDVLRYLHRLRGSMRELSVSGCVISSDAYRVFGRMKLLEVLDISRSRATEHSVRRAVSELPAIQYLDAHSTPLLRPSASLLTSLTSLRCCVLPRSLSTADAMAELVRSRPRVSWIPEASGACSPHMELISYGYRLDFDRSRKAVLPKRIQDLVGKWMECSDCGDDVLNERASALVTFLYAMSARDDVRPATAKLFDKCITTAPHMLRAVCNVLQNDPTSRGYLVSLLERFYNEEEMSICLCTLFVLWFQHSGSDATPIGNCGLVGTVLCNIRRLLVEAAHFTCTTTKLLVYEMNVLMMCADCPRFMDEVICGDGIRVLAEIVRLGTNPTLQALALDFVHNLAISSRFQKLIGEHEGFISSIINVMARNVNVIEIQRSGLGALLNLADLEANRSIMMEEHVVDCVLRALPCCQQHNDVVGYRNAVGTLANLSASDRFRLSMIQKGCIPYLLELRSVDNCALQYWLTWCLTNLLSVATCDVLGASERQLVESVIDAFVSDSAPENSLHIAWDSAVQLVVLLKSMNHSARNWALWALTNLACIERQVSLITPSVLEAILASVASEPNCCKCPKREVLPGRTSKLLETMFTRISCAVGAGAVAALVADARLCFDGVCNCPASSLALVHPMPLKAAASTELTALTRSHVGTFRSGFCDVVPRAGSVGSNTDAGKFDNRVPEAPTPSPDVFQACTGDGTSICSDASDAENAYRLHAGCGGLSISVSYDDLVEIGDAVESTSGGSLSPGWFGGTGNSASGSAGSLSDSVSSLDFAAAAMTTHSSHDEWRTLYARDGEVDALELYTDAGRNVRRRVR